MMMLRRIKSITLRDNVKSVDIRMELGMNSIQEKVREMILRWYGHMQRLGENNELRATVDMIVSGKIPRGRLRARCMDCVRKDMQELRITPDDALENNFGGQEFGPLTPPSGKRRRRRRRIRFLYSRRNHGERWSRGRAPDSQSRGRWFNPTYRRFET